MLSSLCFLLYVALLFYSSPFSWLWHIDRAVRVFLAHRTSFYRKLSSPDNKESALFVWFSRAIHWQLLILSVVCFSHPAPCVLLLFYWLALFVWGKLPNERLYLTVRPRSGARIFIYTKTMFTHWQKRSWNSCEISQWISCRMKNSTSRESQVRAGRLKKNTLFHCCVFFVLHYQTHWRRSKKIYVMLMLHVPI